jgi:hypothetical protein
VPHAPQLALSVGRSAQVVPHNVAVPQVVPASPVAGVEVPHPANQAAPMSPTAPNTNHDVKDFIRFFLWVNQRPPHTA